MVDIKKAIPLAPKYAPFDVKVFKASKHGGTKQVKASNKANYFLVIKPANIARKTGLLAARRGHKFDYGEGENYLIAVYWPLVSADERKDEDKRLGQAVFQKWANRFALGLIPDWLRQQVEDKSADLPPDWDEIDLGNLLELTFAERDELQFREAHCIGMSVDERRAIYAKREKERKRKSAQDKRRQAGSKSRIEISAEARKKEREREAEDISRTTEWRRKKAGREGKKGRE